MSERRVFISYSSKDLSAAQHICAALEKRGCPCWIANRDVGAGENYQESIVQAIEQASVMVLVFSANSNESKEITKELSLASRMNLVVIPARTEDVAPSGAFAYEISTRQWIDLFHDWEGAIEGLASRVRAILSSFEPETEAPRAGAVPNAAGLQAAPEKAKPESSSAPARGVVLGAALAVLALAAGGGLFLLKVQKPEVQSSYPVETGGADKAASVDQAGRSAKPEAPARPISGPPPAPVEPQMPSPAPSAPSRLAQPSAAAPSASDVGAGGQLFRDCPNCPVMTTIPAGATFIGSPASESGHDSTEEPRRKVTFARPFAIGRDEVTFAEWQACVADGGCGQYWPTDMGWGQADRPVIFVSWSDAGAYVKWLAQKTGKPYRLPSEAEWEYAARGCNSASCADKPFWFGDASNPDRANYDWRVSYGGGAKAQPPRKTLPVGRYGPNGFGLFDASGNVAQWTQDCWNPDLRNLPADGTAQSKGDCLSRVYRGGSWTDEPLYLRSAARKSDLASSRLPYVGFRVARDLP
jgi:formylglycine-generating enzyme required for sulfatase activity